MYGTIVVGTDGSPTAGLAVERAAALAAATGDRLVLVSAYRPVPEDRLAEERRDAPEDIAWRINRREEVDSLLAAAAKAAGALGARVEVKAVVGPPADVILDVVDQESAGLVVVGNVGMTGARRFLVGSVPNKITHHAACDVLVVRTTPSA